MTARAPVPGVYVARDEIPELGIAAGEYLTIESPGEKNPYMVHRIVTRSLAEMILASPGVLLLPKGETQETPTAPEIDIDALLANAKIVTEPNAGDLLHRAHQTDAWWRWISRRDDRGRRAICPQCNTAFIRDMNKVRRCRPCRGASYPRACVECGEHFDAHHFMVKRCPRCRARHLGVRCDTCNEYFVQDWYYDTSCRRCR